jgi:hypothetical protein
LKEPKSTVNVLTELLHKATQFSSSIKKICYGYIRKLRSTLSADDIEAILTRHRTLAFTCLQSYLEPRADSSMTISINLEDDFYSAKYSSIHGVKQLAVLQLQQKMMEVAKVVVLRIHEAERKQVEKLELDFILDSDKTLWLVSVLDCRLTVKVSLKQLSINLTSTSDNEETNRHGSQSLVSPVLNEASPQHEPSSLPLISRIYEQTREKALKRKSVKNRVASESTEPGPSKMADSLVILDSPRLQTSNFKDLLAKYIKQNIHDLFTTPAAELSPVKVPSKVYSDTIETSELVLPKAKTLSLLRNSSLDIKAKATARKPRRSNSIYAIDYTTSRLDKVMQQLQTRQQKLSQKYGSTLALPKRVVTPIKLTVKSPYATQGMKI